jgi:hypothetical protein
MFLHRFVGMLNEVTDILARTVLEFADFFFYLAFGGELMIRRVDYVWIAVLN